MQEQPLNTADLLVVGCYFVIIVGVGIWASFVSKGSSVQGYFLAGRTMSWYMIGASLFVSNIGSEHFVGLAGSGASGGVGVGAWELNALLLLQLLGWVFIPVYISSGISTMPEYLEKRFGGNRLRIYLAVLTLILYCLTKISVNLYSGALFIKQALGWPFYTSVIILVLLTGIMTITGGLTVVMYTDSFQAVLMIAGAVYLTTVGFMKVGGYYAMKEAYMQAIPNITFVKENYNITINPNNECFPKPANDSFRILKEIDHPETPWLGFLIGQTPSSIWYWCTDQVIVQRALAARSLSQAQGGTLMAGLIKALPLYIMVMPGMISRILFTDALVCVPGDHCAAVCGSETGCTNNAYPKLVLGIMPSGARGLMMAVMIAALMSDLDSIFNSASTIFTLDLYKKIKKTASNAELIIVGRCFIVVLIGVSVAWVPIIENFQGGQLFFYIQEVSNYISPPIAAIFLVSMLWTKCTEKGAFYGGLSGSLLGIIRLIFIFASPQHMCGVPDTRPNFITNLHYMYYSAIIFITSIIVCIFVSLITWKDSSHHQNISRLTFWTRYGSDCSLAKRESVFSDDIVSSVEMQPMNGSNSVNIKENENFVFETKIVEKGFLRKFFTLVCQVEFNNDDVLNEKPQEFQLRSLEQSYLQKKLLGLGFIVSCSIGVGMYIFWSLPE